MKRILWKGRMVEICVQFAVIFGPFLQAGSDCVQYRLYNDSSQIVSRTWSNFDKVLYILHLQAAHQLFKSTYCTVHTAVRANTKKIRLFCPHFLPGHQFFSDIRNLYYAHVKYHNLIVRGVVANPPVQYFCNLYLSVIFLLSSIGMSVIIFLS